MAKIQIYAKITQRDKLEVEKMEYFDYRKVAKEMNVPHVILKKIEKEMKTEFPKDKMMYELHVLRTLRSRYWEKAPFS
jgi:hypothetical protein